MPLNTEVDYNHVVIKGTVELGVKGERGLQGFKGDQGIQGPPVPVAHELGDDPELAVSQKLLTDSIAGMEQSNESAVTEATHQAGLAGDSATVATDQAGIAASSAGESEQRALAASVSALSADQHASTATEQAGIAAVKAGEASSSASDAASQAGLAAASQAAAEQAATIATTKADEASQSAQAAAQSATQAEETLDSKVDKVAGYSLVDDDEIAKLLTVEQDAQKNTVSSVAGKQGDVLLDKSDVGLGAVDNTSDADKPVSTAVAAALAGKVDAEAGRQLSDENYTLAEKDKLSGVAVEATKNRDDSENADKVHSHAISDVTGLSSRLSDTDTLIRRYILSTPFTPYHLFINKEKGFWADPSDTSTLFQNTDGTIPVTASGDPIGLVLDKTGNNYHLTQTVSTRRPKLLNGVIVFDRVDDALTLNVPAGGITGTLFLATTRGTASYGVSMRAGVWTLGNLYNPLGDVVSAVLVDRVLTEGEKARLHVFGVGKGGTEFGLEKTFTYAYREWSHLVDFPLIDTSRATALYGAWYGCSGLTSFPVLDVSGVITFERTFAYCSNLTSFPANFFDNCLAVNFINAFNSTNLSQASIDGILVSINSNNTANGTFLQSGGSAPSIVGQAAIDAMRSRGWTVTTAGGY